MGTQAARQTPWDPEDLLAQVASHETLMTAWHDVLRNAQEKGSESKALRQFERGALRRLLALSEQLLDGTYRPDSVTRVSMDDEGKPRTLLLSSVRDRVLERSLSQVLTRWIDPRLSPLSYGYRRGLGVREAIMRLAQARDEGATHVLRTDVRNAFDSLPRTRLMNSLSSHVPDARVLDVVGLLVARLDEAGLAGVGVAQGSSLSPLLLNVYLDRFDADMMDEEFLAIRFADDIAIPVSNEETGRSAFEHVAESLRELGLDVNDEKTTIDSFNDGVTFLGTTLRSTGAPRDDSEHPREITVVVQEAGALLRLRKEHVRVDRDGESIASVHVGRVRQLVLSGRVGVTTPLLHRALKENIDVILLSESGGYLGRLGRRRTSDPATRRAQYRAADSGDRALAFARCFVAGKIANMRVAVLRADRQTGDVSATSRALEEGLARIGDHADDALTTFSLMGLEGAATRQYFSWMSNRLDADWGFEGRQRRPPPDPVNAMLSYGYTLLTGEVIAACEQAGLDPDIGFLHSDRWGRPSLALDLMEEWRPVIVDAVVSRLISTRQVRPRDFVATQNRGCRMTDSARSAFHRGYERRMLTKAGSADGGREPYRRLLVRQARHLAEQLVDGAHTYRSHLWR